jgi:23S rRNA pseudouridine2604 synthase
MCRPDRRISKMSEQEMRLSKRMVELGLCSRREADAFIEQGRVGWMVRWYNNWAAGSASQRIELDSRAWCWAN